MLVRGKAAAPAAFGANAGASLVNGFFAGNPKGCILVPEYVYCAHA